ncbi:hypothetical protein ACFX2F_006539 [Malus domestica]
MNLDESGILQKCVIIEDIEELRVAISITKGSGSKLKKGRAKWGVDHLEKWLCLLNYIAYNGDDEHEAEDGPLNANDEGEGDEDDKGDETEEGHEIEEVNEGAEVEANDVNAEDDSTNSEFVDNDYSLEDDDCRAVDDTVVENVIGDAEGDSDGLHSVDDSSSECDEKIIYLELNEEADMDDPKFENGLKLRNAAPLRKAVWSHSIKYGAHSIKLKRNEKWKISARCEKNCPWRLYASRMYNEDSMQVKTYVGKHDCLRIWRENPNCKVAWLVKRYVDKFRLNPSMPITTFMETVKEERIVEIHLKTAYRVRAQCLKILEGSNVNQYTKLWEYCDELRRTNSGSTFQMKVLPYDDAHVIFQKIYICLGACKNGFKNGCRPFVGLDGCHLKGVFKGQLLSAVGMDANNQTWVIAYDIVELEDKDI